MITVSEEDKLLFEKNGFSQEDVAKTVQHYRELGISDEEIQNKINSQIANFSSQEKEVEQPTEQPQQDIISEKQGIDISPSGLLQKGTAAVLSPISALVRGQSIPEAYHETMRRNAQYEKEHPIASSIPKFGLDLFGYNKITPTVKAGNAFLNWLANSAIQGGVVGGIEGLKENKPLEGALMGTGTAGALNGAAPLVVKGVNKGYEKVGRPVLNALSKSLLRLPIETIEQAVKPTSKALDMNAVETQDALRNLTKQVGSKFDAIKEDAQENIVKVMNSIQKNKKGMPVEAELQPKVKQANLLQDLEDLYYGASFSNHPSATRYFKADKYRQNIADWLDELADANKEISAPKLYDVMNRIKGDVKWNTTSENEDAVNQFLRRLYGAYSERLKTTVPQLKKPFKEYQDLMELRNSEGVKQILQPLEADRTSQAASALKNQGRIITQGEARNNLKKLEDLFVKNNFNGFMDSVDDINAAQELNKTLMTGDSGWQGFLRETVGRAGMTGARKFNKSRKALKGAYDNVIKKFVTPSAIKGANTTLYGGVSNTVPVDEYNNYDVGQY